MSLKLLHSIAVQDQLVAADGVITFDLPVNPLSHLLIKINPLNDHAGTPVAWSGRYLDICDAVNQVRVLYRGASIVNVRGRDLAVLNYHRHGILPMEANPDDTDNERRCVVLPVLMGKFAWDPESCFPATRRGELTLELDVDIADTSYDGVRISVESVEILGATPREYERKAQIAKTFAATGQQDFQLPLGNTVRGALLFGTTGFTGASPAPSWGRIKVLLDNQEYGYSGIDFETTLMLGQLMGRQPPYLDSHTHRVDATAASTIQETGGPIEQGGSWGNWGFLDFDPTRDDTFSIDTSKASTFELRAEVETADAVRVIPIERISV